MKVLCLGEVLIDMLSQGAAPKEGNIPAMKPFQPYAGGAPANVAVGVAQLGGESAMVSKVGNDTFGAFLTEMLICFLTQLQEFFQLFGHRLNFLLHAFFQLLYNFY